MKRTLGWALLTLAVMMTLALVWDPSSRAAKQEQDRANQRRPVAENYDVRVNGSKETLQKLDAREQATKGGREKQAQLRADLAHAREAFKAALPGAQIDVNEITQAPEIVRAQKDKLARPGRGRSAEALDCALNVQARATDASTPSLSLAQTPPATKQSRQPRYTLGTTLLDHPVGLPSKWVRL